MPIKSTVSDTPCKKKELPFPKLIQETKHPKNIALVVNSSGSCTIIAGCNLGMKFRYSMDLWHDFIGSVCLENSDKI